MTPAHPLAAVMAQSYAGETYRGATYRNIQIFGAIGFTSEMNNHLFYKRRGRMPFCLACPPSNAKMSSAVSRRMPPEPRPTAALTRKRASACW
jgi:alkylation response protein AidB-like acyl-CoA dehydrogenase